jgi:hypothetical protein
MFPTLVRPGLQAAAHDALMSAAKCTKAQNQGGVGEGGVGEGGGNYGGETFRPRAALVAAADTHMQPGD